MFKSGRRLFTAGSIGLLVVAALHTVGHFAPDEPNAALEAVEQGMRSYTIDMGLGMKPNLLGILRALSLTMSIMLLGLGLQNLVVAASSSTTPVLVRRMAIVSAVVTSGLVALYAYYQIPPPCVTIAIVDAMFIGAIVTSGRAE
ncbi:MAG TPA: hypothetical protein PLF26_08555 [Blastocatellia bacterium]|nr:hypothetical protein [Blastocatellia bacterium]